MHKGLLPPKTLGGGGTMVVNGEQRPPPEADGGFGVGQSRGGGEGGSTCLPCHPYPPKHRLCKIPKHFGNSEAPLGFSV